MIFFEYKNIEEKKELSINIRSNGCIHLNSTIVKKIGLKKDDKIRFGYDPLDKKIGISKKNGNIKLSQYKYNVIGLIYRIVSIGDNVTGLFFISRPITRFILGDNKKVQRYIFADFEDGLYIFDRENKWKTKTK